MRQTDFPGCCTAQILYDLGGTTLSAGRKSNYRKSDIEDWLDDELKMAEGTVCTVIITNDTQLQVNNLLVKRGFKHSAWMKKKQHSDSKIRLWWKEPM
jgi:hypothetical protein